MEQLGAFANVGTFDLAAALKANDISTDVQRHLVRVYALLAIGVAMAGVGAWLGIATPLLGSLGVIGTFGLLLALAFQQDKSASASRIGLYLAFATCQGLGLARLVDVLLVVDPSILITALLGTSGTFAAFTLGALLSKRRSLLYVGGICGSILSWLFIAGLVNMFMRSEAVFAVELYVGLFMFVGFVVFDSQMIVERASLGDKDSVGHATTLLVDFVALFVRIAIVLLRNQEKRQERDRRDRR